MKKILMMSFFLLSAMVGMSTKEKGFSKLTGSYLGQKPQGMTPDVSLLFFTSKRSSFGSYDEESQSLAMLKRRYAMPGNGLEDICWVDAEIIEQLKPKNLKNERRK